MLVKVNVVEFCDDRDMEFNESDPHDYVTAKDLIEFPDKVLDAYKREVDPHPNSYTDIAFIGSFVEWLTAQHDFDLSSALACLASLAKHRGE